MRLLFLGDVVGKSGRDAVVQNLPMLRDRLQVDCAVVNAENAAHGFGITPAMAEELYRAGVDCLTTGNHVWAKREIIAHIDGDHRLLRPVNYPPGTPGRGATIIEIAGDRRVLVINALARVFMDPIDDPFAAVDRAIGEMEMPRDVDAIVVDFHGEATSEKMAMGHFLDGRVSLVVGTHSHVPTADVMVLTAGTAYQTDAGMCGDYDSIIGMKKSGPLYRFTRSMPGERMEPAEGPATLCGLVVDIDGATGLARHAAPLRFGGRLAPAWPAA